MNITRSCWHAIFDGLKWSIPRDGPTGPSHPVNPVPFEDSPTDTSILDVLHKVNAGLRAGKMTVPGWQLYLAADDLHIPGP
jgi:hypothetical protein